MISWQAPSRKSKRRLRHCGGRNLLLEHRPPGATGATAIGRSYWSVWILIGAIWISATVVVATATGAILYILG